MWYSQFIRTLVISSFIFFSGSLAFSQSDTLSKKPARMLNPVPIETSQNQVGVGFQATSPVIGLGFKYEVAPNIDIKAALGPFNTFTTAGVRIEAYQRRDMYNALCYISYGSGSYDYPKDESDKNSSWHGAGVGIGLEYFPSKSREFGFSGDVGFLKYWHTDPNERNYATINGGAAVFYYLR